MAAMYKLQPEKKNAADKAYYSAHKEERDASIKLTTVLTRRIRMPLVELVTILTRRKGKPLIELITMLTWRIRMPLIELFIVATGKEKMLWIGPIKNSVDRAAYRANVSKRKAAANSRYLANREVLKAAFKSYRATHHRGALESTTAIPKGFELPRIDIVWSSSPTGN